MISRSLLRDGVAFLHASGSVWTYQSRWICRIDLDAHEATLFSYLVVDRHSTKFTRNFMAESAYFTYLYIYTRIRVTLSANRRIFIFLRAIKKKKEKKERCTLCQIPIERSKITYSVLVAQLLCDTISRIFSRYLLLFFSPLARSDKQLREALRDEKMMLQLCFCYVNYSYASIVRKKKVKEEDRIIG